MFLRLRTVVDQVQDLNKAKSWYSSVLGIQPYFDQPLHVGFKVGGYELGLVPEPDAGAKRAAAGLAYWDVKDARAAYQRLLDLGATAQEPARPGRKSGGWSRSRSVRKHSGRDPESQFQNRSKLSAPALGHDDAGRFFRRLRRKRKAGTQEIEERAGAGAAVGFLLAHAQKKNQQVEHIRVLQ
jgi:catechol 2,3-dioxygenase-like lactoylglutathione lyase family enzyme